jgi:hypothetical protein
MDADWFEFSTGMLLGGCFLSRRAAPWEVVHNTAIVWSLRKLQERNRYCALEIHKVFPALSPRAHQTKFELGVSVVQCLHNYDPSIVKSSILYQGEKCEACTKGNRLPAVQTICWRDGILACGFMCKALTRVRRLIKSPREVLGMNCTQPSTTGVASTASSEPLVGPQAIAEIKIFEVERSAF